MRDALTVGSHRLRDGVCSSAGWSPPGSAGYNCTFHGIPLEQRLGEHAGRTRVLVSGCARKLGKLLSGEGQTIKMIDSVLRHVTHAGSLVFADGAELDDTYAALKRWTLRDGRARAILAMH